MEVLLRPKSSSELASWAGEVPALPSHPPIHPPILAPTSSPIQVCCPPTHPRPISREVARVGKERKMIINRIRVFPSKLLP